MNVLAFMFASTNLIVELGLMIWILLGWEFLVAELLRGLVLIAVMAVIVRLTLPEAQFDRVREELVDRDREAGVTEDPTCGLKGSEEFTLTTDRDETLQFCSEGCLETYRQEAASRDGWRDELLSWGGWYKLQAGKRSSSGTESRVLSHTPTRLRPWVVKGSGDEALSPGSSYPGC